MSQKKPWMQPASVQQITQMPFQPKLATLTQRANLLPLQATSQPISKLPIAPLMSTDSDGSKLILWVETPSGKTLFAPIVVERMARVTAMKNGAAKLIEAMRCTAQPNRHFRAERLVPSDVNAVSERLDFARSLNDSTSCYDNMQPLINYAREAAQLETTIDQHHEIFLRQVMVFCVKPMKEFLDYHVPQIVRAHSDLEKSRDKWDALRKTKPEQSKLYQSRLEFLAQARVLAAQIDQVPTHQMTFAKAIDFFVRAEAAFAGQVTKLSATVKQPDSGSRWSP